MQSIPSEFLAIDRRERAVGKDAVRVVVEVPAALKVALVVGVFDRKARHDPVGKLVVGTGRQTPDVRFKAVFEPSDIPIEHLKLG